VDGKTQNGTLAGASAVDQRFSVTVPADAAPTAPYFTRPNIEQPYYDLDRRALSESVLRAVSAFGVGRIHLRRRHRPHRAACRYRFAANGTRRSEKSADGRAGDFRRDLAAARASCRWAKSNSR
jgi:hypothetical protein